MGFRREPTLYRLHFEDPEFEGLEVLAGTLPLKDLLAINKMAKSEDPEDQMNMFRKFARALVEWNLEDDKGKPVPATFDGLLSQDVGFVNEIIRAWMEAVSNVPNSSRGNSNGVRNSTELSLPMEVS